MPWLSPSLAVAQNQEGNQTEYKGHLLGAGPISHRLVPDPRSTGQNRLQRVPSLHPVRMGLAPSYDRDWLLPRTKLACLACSRSSPVEVGGAVLGGDDRGSRCQ